MIDSYSEIANRQFSGFYFGEVVWHSDAGKIKVFIPGVYPDSWKQNPQLLPDCLQMTPLFGGSNNGNGVFSYPNYGTIVICYLQNNDQNFPVALGALLGGSSNENSLAGDQYKKCYKDSSPKNKNNGTDACVHIINSGNTSIKLYENGRTEIFSNDGNNLSGKYSLVTINGDGTINLSSNVKVSIQSPEILLSSSTMLELDSKQITLNAADGIINLQSGSFINDASKQIYDKSSHINLDASTGQYEFHSKSDYAVFRS